MKAFFASNAIRRGLLLLPFVVLAACSSPPPQQFAEFAKLGTTLTDTTPPLLDAAFSDAVRADSQVLATARQDLPDRKERLTALNTHNESLKSRLAIYGDLIRHSRLLRSYFVTLGLLADSSGDSGLGNGAKNIVDQLARIHPDLENALMGDVAVADFVKAAAPAAVGAFRSIALQRELEARSKAVTEELDLQQAVLTAIAEQMRDDIELQLQERNRLLIDEPFMGTGPLPADWAQKRIESLQTPIALKAVEAAAQAADNLRASFIVLTEGGGAGASLSQLLQDVSTVVSLVEALRTPAQ